WLTVLSRVDDARDPSFRALYSRDSGEVYERAHDEAGEAPMAIQLNHTIVHARDPAASAQFLADILGVPGPKPFGPFMEVHVDNDVTLAFIRAEAHEIIIEHYAFLVSEGEFDQIFGRIRERGLQYWADPAHRHPGV